jgi:hypothetical protein
MVIEEKLVEWKLAWETEVLGQNLPLRHFVHHKSHTIRPRAAAVGSQRLTAWAMIVVGVCMHHTVRRCVIDVSRIVQIFSWQFRFVTTFFVKRRHRVSPLYKIRGNTRVHTSFVVIWKADKTVTVFEWIAAPKHLYDLRSCSVLTLRSSSL